MRLSVAATALLLVLAPGIAAADGVAPVPSRAPAPAPSIDLSAELSWTDRLDLMWSQFRDRVMYASLPAAPSRSGRDAALEERRRQRDEFAWLMNIAGYKLKEVESALGIVPSLSLTFAQARQLTEADRDYVERQLERHAMLHPWPMAALRRAIVRSVLEASELGEYSVSKVEVELLPLPKVKLVIEPVDAPLGADASRLMHAIDRLGDLIRQRPVPPRVAAR
jgi:hypothetical protein